MIVTPMGMFYVKFFKMYSNKHTYFCCELFYCCML